MGKKDPRVDAYIARSGAFARPILKHLRSLVHDGCPGVVETMKWSRPAFDYKGPMCGMAAFKAHCTFGFWKGGLMGDGTGPLGMHEGAMGQYGRITSIRALPSESTMRRLVREAAALNEAGVKAERVRAAPKPLPKLPSDFEAALQKNKQALAVFAGFPPSHKREYLEWILGAKAAETRARRLSSAIEWIAEGKSRNWKYEPKR
jgi:hypothetical protein